MKSEARIWNVECFSSFLKEKTWFSKYKIKFTAEGSCVGEVAGIPGLWNVVIFDERRFRLRLWPLTALRCLQIMTLDDGLWASLRSNSPASPPAPPPRYTQLWPGGGAVTITLWLVTQDKWLTLLFCACFFLICCDDEAVLTHSLAAAGEVLSWKFALLCQLSSKMSLCAPKTLRSYDSNINTPLIEIFLFPRQMEVNVVKKRHRTRSKGVRGEFVRFLLFLKDPHH